MNTIFRNLLFINALLSLSTTFSVSHAQTSSEKIFTIVEKQPEFPGGKAALSRYLATTIKIPGSLLRKSYNTGPVSARFIIDTNGATRDPRITIRPLSKRERKNLSEFMASIITSVEQMPRWQPAEVNGQPVAMFYTLPIEVSLK